VLVLGVLGCAAARLAVPSHPDRISAVGVVHLDQPAADERTEANGADHE
jgi:hypothetical protein